VTITNATTRAIIEYINAIGGLAWRNNTGAFKGAYLDKQGNNKQRFVPFGQKGSGDVLALWRGTFYSIEVKTGKDKLRPSQVDWIERVNARGGVAFVAKTVDDVIERMTQ